MSSKTHPEVCAMGFDYTRDEDTRYLQHPGCNCPPWRYCPWIQRPTNPACPEHGGGGA